jgi:hypothetical protein
MPTLLSLPRELRDMIVEHVLLTSTIKLVLPTFPDCLRHPTDPPFPLPSSPLLSVCQQLRAETLSAIPRINVPLVLNLVVLDNGRVACTWQSVPWKKVWRRINMQINIIVRPMQEYCDREEMRTKRFQRERIAKTVRRNVLKALRVYLDINGELVPTERISTTIAQLKIDVRMTPEVAQPLTNPSKEAVKALRFSQHALAMYTAALAPHLSDILFKYNPWPWSEIAHSHERENIAILSRTKEVELCCNANVVFRWDFDRLLDMTRLDLSKTQIKMRKEAGEERRTLAWDMVEGKEGAMDGA